MEEIFEDGLEISFQWLLSLSGLSNFVSPQSSSLSSILAWLHGKNSVSNSRLLHSFVRLLGVFISLLLRHTACSHTKQTSHVSILHARATFLPCFLDLLISCLLTAAMACFPSLLPWLSLALPSINVHNTLTVPLPYVAGGGLWLRDGPTILGFLLLWRDLVTTRTLIKETFN